MKPEIRFKNDSNEWKETELKNICDIKKGTQLNKADMTKQGEYYVLNGGVLPSGYTDNYNTEADTISISEGGNSCGYVNYNEEKFWSGGDNYTLENVLENNDFVYQELKVKENEIMMLRRGSGLPHVSIDDLENLKLSVPDNETQQSIASLYSNVDSEIKLQTEKKEKLQQIKSAFMRVIVQSNKETGKIYFKDLNGNLFPEWEEKKLKDIANIFLGLTYTPEYVDSGIPFLSCKDIKNGKIDWSNHHFITNEEFEKSTSNAKPQNGDILFGRVGTLGNPVVLKDMPDFCIFVSLGFLRMKKDEYLNSFIAQWMNSNVFKNMIEERIAGSSQKNLNTGWLKEFEILIPCFEEQKKIASLFSNLDEKIYLQTEKINKLKQTKEALLYKMFPQEQTFTPPPLG